MPSPVPPDATAPAAPAEPNPPTATSLLEAFARSPVLLFEMDTDLRYTWIGSSWRGMDTGPLLGRTDAEIFPGEGSAQVTAVKRAAVETGEPQRAEVGFGPLENQSVFDLTAIPLLDADGRVVSVRCVGVDISELRAMEAEFLRTQAWLQDILDNSTSLVFRKDRTGRIVQANRALQDIAPFIGKRSSETAAVDGDQHEANDREVLASGRPRRFLERLLLDGDERWFVSEKFPVHGPHGEIEGVGGIATEITEQVRLNDELNEQRAALTRAERLGRMGSWQLDRASGELHWSPECFRIWQVPVADHPDQMVFPSRLAAGDGEALVKIKDDALAGRAGEVEHRILLPDDSVRWAISRAEPVFNAEGEVVGVQGITLDVTERRRLVAQLRNEQASLRALLDASPLGILRVTREGEVIMANQAAGELLGETPGHLAGMRLDEIPGAGSLGAYWLTLVRSVAVTAVASVVTGSLGHARSARWIETTVAPEPVEGASVRQLVCLLLDVTARRHLEEALSDAALRDPLTGLASRRLLVESAQRDLALLSRDPARSVALFVVDLDDFAQVNQTLGELRADEVLGDVATVLREVVRPADVVARLSDDDFAVLLSGVGRDEAGRIVERARVRLGEVLGVPDRQVTTSIGLAVTEVNGMEADTLLQRAADAAREAYRAGGDRLVWWVAPSEAVAPGPPGGAR